MSKLFFYTDNKDKFYQFLLILFAAVFPLSVSAGNIVAYIICLIWLLSGDYHNKFHQIKSSNIAKASILFFLVHVLGMLWTENLTWGIHILKKMLDFIILLPIFITLTHLENHRAYINAFLFSIFITLVFSYTIYFDVNPFYVFSNNPTPFMSHISHTPFMAIASYILMIKCFGGDSQTKFFHRASMLIFLSLVVINIFITGGRAGQLAFFVLFALTIFQTKGLNIKSFIYFLILSSLTLVSALFFSELFQERFLLIFKEILEYDISTGSSIGQRITFAINSIRIISENLILGVGTGDFPDSYRQISMIFSPGTRDTVNPHNMYILVMAQNGILGLLSFLLIFYNQYKEIRGNFFQSNTIAPGILIFFIFINFSDSYLLGHFITFLFVFFSSFCFKSNNVKK